MNIHEFRKEYFNKCTEEGLYSRVTKISIKLAPFVILSCILLMAIVLSRDLKYSIVFILLTLVLIIYPVLLLYKLYAEKKKSISMVESEFNKLLKKYGIKSDDHEQIDLIIDIINSNPTSEKYSRIINIVTSVLTVAIGGMVLKFWEIEFNISHDVISFTILTIYAYVIYALIKYLFEEIYINEQAHFDKDLIYKLKNIKLLEIRKSRNKKNNKMSAKKGSR